MKTKLTIVLMAAILFFTTATAQESKNMEFMGIPITGNINNFSNKLQSKGFKPSPKIDGFITLRGKFTNRDVFLMLAPISGTNDIYRIGVVYDPDSSWANLESFQNYLVEAFTKKYGEPSDSERKIDSIYKDSGNYILLGFYNGEVQYSDSWKLPNGSIYIQIISDALKSARIMIIYEDSISAQTLEENIMNDI